MLRIISQSVLSRKDASEFFRWITTLIMGLAYVSNDTIGLVKKRGLKVTDPERLNRIVNWGIKNIKVISNKYTQTQDAILSGQLDSSLAADVKEVSRLILSLEENFRQIGFDVNTEIKSWNKCLEFAKKFSAL